MSRLYLACFNQSTLWPQHTAHWALLLIDTNDSTVGTVFHAAKPPGGGLGAGVSGYQMQRNVSLQRSSTLRSCVEIATQLPLTLELLDQQCQAAAAGRTFDLAVNNCQRFVTDVLIRLVHSGVISADQYRQLAAKRFTPLIGGPGVI